MSNAKGAEIELRACRAHQSSGERIFQRNLDRCSSRHIICSQSSVFPLVVENVSENTVLSTQTDRSHSQSSESTVLFSSCSSISVDSDTPGDQSDSFNYVLMMICN